MTAAIFLLKSQTIFLILIKVSLLLKYFSYQKFKESDWRVRHIIYFSQNEILFTKDLQRMQAKRIQNVLTNAILHLAILVILIRLAVKMLG